MLTLMSHDVTKKVLSPTKIFFFSRINLFWVTLMWHHTATTVRQSNSNSRHSMLRSLKEINKH